MSKTETIDNDVCRMLAELAAVYGVLDVIVSPGTRSAPLAVVFHRSGSFRMHTVVDERCAAFIALGISLKTDRPVVMICTSGSALMNYGPAFAEALYRRVPLIALSADRPARWVDQLDSQTMRQADALSAVVRYSTDIPVGAAHDASLFALANRKVNEAFSAAIYGRGPAHINVQLDVPLTAMTSAAPQFKARYIRTAYGAVSPASFSDIVDSLHGKKVMMICGDTSRAERDALCNTFIPDIPLLTEVQSNLAQGLNIAWIDRFLGSDTGPELVPDIIITIGGSLVSARLKRWLRKIGGLRHITVGHTDNIIDTFGCLDTRIECNPAAFLKALSSNKADSEFASRWQSFYDECSSRSAAFVAANPLINIVFTLMSSFSGDIHISNGSAIRYAQFAMPRCHGNVMCNRGISGIDGCTSTALGAAIVSDSPTLLITGDMSAAYDVGALGAALPPQGFRIAVLDNAGGDIFRNISATSNLPELDRYFVAPPRLPLRELAGAYGYRYLEYDCAEPDAGTLRQFLEPSGKAAILRIIIDPKYSAGLL